MSGPEMLQEYVPCGPDIAPLVPTPHLQFKDGVLQQWHEATTRDAYGSTHYVGMWRPVPQR